MTSSVHGAPRETLPERVAAFLIRQNGWFERALEELSQARPGQDEGELAALIQRHAALAEERAVYERELAELSTEWRKASEDNPGSIPDAARARIRALAKKGESLTEQLRAAYEEALANVKNQTKHVRGAIEALNKGRSLLRRYAPGRAEDALFIDRKA
jgi:exonuclease VII large subunit